MDVPTDRLPLKGILKDLGRIPELNEVFKWSGERWVCEGYEGETVIARPAPDR